MATLITSSNHAAKSTEDIGLESAAVEEPSRYPNPFAAPGQDDDHPGPCRPCLNFTGQTGRRVSYTQISVLDNVPEEDDSDAPQALVGPGEVVESGPGSRSAMLGYRAWRRDSGASVTDAITDDLEPAYSQVPPLHDSFQHSASMFDNFRFTSLDSNPTNSPLSPSSTSFARPGTAESSFSQDDSFETPNTPGWSPRHSGSYTGIATSGYSFRSARTSAPTVHISTQNDSSRAPSFDADRKSMEYQLDAFPEKGVLDSPWVDERNSAILVERSLLKLGQGAKVAANEGLNQAL